MSKRVLVTGGAGFIGSFIVDKLVEQGNDVTIFDNIEPQVHPNGKIPTYLNKKANFIKGDMKDYNAVKEMIKDAEIILHKAAMVGVGQSMYQIKRYVEANTLGTANLLNALISTEHNVKKLIVASSMSTYGEGSYKCGNCGSVEPQLRPEEQMAKQDWELHCPKCGKTLKPMATKESKKQEVNSIYAITKKDQEDMVLNIGRSYGIPSVALRYFNVYGPRQSLSNPYTGVVAIFMSRLKNNNKPIVYEDGNQTRDFISIHDIVESNLLAMNQKAADYEVFNVGTGKAISIKQIAETLAKLLDMDIKPEITNKFRRGDVRHCFSDISKIKSKLGFEPKVSFEQGLKELIEWSANVKAEEKFEQAADELKKRKLI